MQCVHLHLMLLFFAFTMIQGQSPGEAQGHPTCLTGSLGLGEIQIQLRGSSSVLWKILFGKSIPLRWRLDERVDATKATCLRGMHQGQGAPTLSNRKNMGGARGSLAMRTQIQKWGSCLCSPAVLCAFSPQ